MTHRYMRLLVAKGIVSIGCRCGWRHPSTLRLSKDVKETCRNLWNGHLYLTAVDVATSVLGDEAAGRSVVDALLREHLLKEKEQQE